MCNSKPKIQTVTAPPAAPPVAAPQEIKVDNLETQKKKRTTKSTGKKKLLINQSGKGGTGVNI